MTRDRLTLRRNLQHVLPNLTADDISVIVECLGYELLGRGIWSGTQLIADAQQLVGRSPRTPLHPPLRSRAS